ENRCADLFGELISAQSEGHRIMGETRDLHQHGALHRVHFRPSWGFNCELRRGDFSGGLWRGIGLNRRLRSLSWSLLDRLLWIGAHAVIHRDGRYDVFT